jgi:hypothetical protein
MHHGGADQNLQFNARGSLNVTIDRYSVTST